MKRAAFPACQCAHFASEAESDQAREQRSFSVVEGYFLRLFCKWDKAANNAVSEIRCVRVPKISKEIPLRYFLLKHKCDANVLYRAKPVPSQI